MSLMREHVVLVLNAAWQAVHTLTPEQAFTNMSGGSMLGMVIEGEDRLYPITWNQWLELSPLTPEFTAHGVKRNIRIPSVVIACNFHKLPLHRPKLTRENVFKRDNYRCAYTGRHLRHVDATVDHIVPDSRNGKNDWENLVTCDRKINQAKNDRTPEEAGLTLQYQPSIPRAVPVSVTIRNHLRIKDWELFLVR